MIQVQGIPLSRSWYKRLYKKKGRRSQSWKGTMIRISSDFSRPVFPGNASPLMITVQSKTSRRLCACGRFAFRLFQPPRHNLRHIQHFNLPAVGLGGIGQHHHAEGAAHRQRPRAGGLGLCRLVPGKGGGGAAKLGVRDARIKGRE